jgi:putative transposase
VLQRPPEPKQYTAIRYADRLTDVGALASIGTVADSYDCEDVGCRQAA